MRRSRIKSLNRWMLPFPGVFVLGFTILPNRILSLVAAPSAADIRGDEETIIVTLSVPGMT